MNVDLKQLNMIDPMLANILTWLESSTRLKYKITSIYRKGDEGVHGTMPVRGIDISMPIYAIGKEIETHVNNYWKYDPKRPNLKCCLYHKGTSGSIYHLHFQVHMNTVFET